MNNSEILNRFDVLYNNIMSNQAPGLDAYEKSVFWNKATLEVMKNHLNPKGNKYTEGYDFSAKRQVEFSELTKTKSAKVAKDSPISTYGPVLWSVIDADFSINDALSIVNERVNVIDSNTYDAVTRFIEGWPSFSLTDIVSLTALIQHVLDNIATTHPMYIKLHHLLDVGIEALGTGIFDEWNTLVSEYHLPLTIYTAIEDLGLAGLITEKVVVPLNNVEYDTLSSRPYPYPPKSQVWRLLMNGNPEFVLSPGVSAVEYVIRYIKLPKEVNLQDAEDIPEVPEVLHDEILQRAVELAKNSWEGTLETHKTFGERSE